MKRVGSTHLGLRRGFTLLELLVGTAIALFLTTAAVVFATHETRLLGYSSDQSEMQQAAKTALELLARDIQMAGAGVGYDTAGNFAGLQIGGSFPTVGPVGSLVMNSSEGNTNALGYTNIMLESSGGLGAERSGTTYVLPTEDIGIVMADGEYATVAFHSGTSGQYCDDGTVFRGNDQRFVLLQSDDRLASRSSLFTPGAATACTFGECVNGCRTFTLANDPYNMYQSNAGAATASFIGGEVRDGLKQVVWFVQNDDYDTHKANLRRAEFSALSGHQCAAGDRGICGGEVAYDVETLQYQVWRFDPTLAIGGNASVDGRWVLVNNANINTTNRLRVDIELVVRSSRQEDRPIEPARLSLRAGFCAPGGAVCPASGAWDRTLRRVHRISVDVKNSAFAGVTN